MALFLAAVFAGAATDVVGFGIDRVLTPVLAWEEHTPHARLGKKT